MTLRPRCALAPLACALVTALLAPRRAGAEVTETPLPLFPDPARFASGLFVEGRGGAAIALGKQAGHVSAGLDVGVWHFGDDGTKHLRFWNLNLLSCPN